VFKVHGSVSSFSSLIATADDYARCYKEIFNGVIGANLRMLLATKTVVFVGYSLRDSDLAQTYEAIKGQMGDVLPQAYAVTTDAASAPRFEALRLRPIVTDATFFIERLKCALVSRGAMQSDEQLVGVNDELKRIGAAHDMVAVMFIKQRTPALMYALCYQDGLIHGLERALSRAATGEYSSPQQLSNQINTYEQILNEKARSKVYHDVAYLEGYLEALYFLMTPATERNRRLSRYFVFGVDEVIQGQREFERALKRARLTKAQIAYATKLMPRVGPENVFHHLPLL
jgi:hypothetical protein